MKNIINNLMTINYPLIVFNFFIEYVDKLSKSEKSDDENI